MRELFIEKLTNIYIYIYIYIYIAYATNLSQEGRLFTNKIKTISLLFGKEGVLLNYKHSLGDAV